MTGLDTSSQLGTLLGGPGGCPEFPSPGQTGQRGVSLLMLLQQRVTEISGQKLFMYWCVFQGKYLPSELICTLGESSHGAQCL